MAKIVVIGTSNYPEKVVLFEIVTFLKYFTGNILTPTPDSKEPHLMMHDGYLSAPRSSNHAESDTSTCEVGLLLYAKYPQRFSDANIQ